MKIPSIRLLLLVAIPALPYGALVAAENTNAVALCSSLLVGDANLVGLDPLDQLLTRRVERTS